MNVLRFAELTSAFNDAESGMTAQENADKITSIMLDASHGVYEEYSKEETNKIEKASYLNYVKIDESSDDDYQLFYNECIENIDKCNYLTTKCISKETQERIQNNNFVPAPKEPSFDGETVWHVFVVSIFVIVVIFGTVIWSDLHG